MMVTLRWPSRRGRWQLCLPSTAATTPPTSVDARPANPNSVLAAAGTKALQQLATRLSCTAQAAAQTAGRRSQVCHRCKARDSLLVH